MKRYREPKAKPGELKMCWGKLRHSSPDICYAWGEGVSKCDGHLLNSVLGTKICEPNWDAPNNSPRFMWTKYGKSLIEELVERGYDLTTLKFSIKKKPTN